MKWNARVLLPWLLLVSFASAGVYKWVDEEGMTHYSDFPPEVGSEEIETAPAPPAEDVRRAREKVDSLLKRQREQEEARRSDRRRQRLDEMAGANEQIRQIDRCIFVEQQLLKLRLQRPVYRVAGKGEMLYVKFMGERDRLKWGEGGQPIFIETSPDGERMYIDDADRPSELEHYSQELESYCAVDDPDFKEAKRQRYRAFMCRLATTHLDALSQPSKRTPASDLEEARRCVDKYCRD